MTSSSSCPICGAEPEHFADLADPAVTLQVKLDAAVAAPLARVAHLEKELATAKARILAARVSLLDAVIYLDEVLP